MTQKRSVALPQNSVQSGLLNVSNFSDQILHWALDATPTGAGMRGMSYNVLNHCNIIWHKYSTFLHNVFFLLLLFKKYIL